MSVKYVCGRTLGNTEFDSDFRLWPKNTSCVSAFFGQGLKVASRKPEGPEGKEGAT